MWLWNIINKTMCKLFRSCEITFGMLWERFFFIVSLAILTNMAGYVCNNLFGIPMLWYNIIISGIISEIVIFIVIICGCIITMYISESYEIFKLKVIVRKYLSRRKTRSGKIVSYISKNSGNLTISIIAGGASVLAAGEPLTFVSVGLASTLVMVLWMVWDYIVKLITKYFLKVETYVIFRCKKKSVEE